MSNELIVMATAFWLGILTSISPCPLATNIAAVSFVSHKSQKLNLVLTSGLFYAFGRILAYSLLSVLIVGSILFVPSISFFFQKYIHLILGPLLILVAMFLLEMISIPFPSFFKVGNLESKIKKRGTLSPIVLGFIFALAFCPVSAALYFGSLIPLAIKEQSPLLISLSYGLGTSLPVLVFSAAIAGGSKIASKLFSKVTLVEKWIRLGTGLTILLIGIYFCLLYIFKIL